MPSPIIASPSDSRKCGKSLFLPVGSEQEPSPRPHGETGARQAATRTRAGTLGIPALQPLGRGVGKQRTRDTARRIGCINFRFTMDSPAVIASWRTGQPLRWNGCAMSQCCARIESNHSRGVTFAASLDKALWEMMALKRVAEDVDPQEAEFLPHLLNHLLPLIYSFLNRVESVPHGCSHKATEGDMSTIDPVSDPLNPRLDSAQEWYSPASTV